MSSHTRSMPGRIAVVAMLSIALSYSAALAVGEPPPDPPPPPPAPQASDSLQYIKQVIIGTRPCSTCPPVVCPDKPVVITVSGVLPDGCVAFRGLRELPVASPFPVIAADFVVDTCGRACPDVLTRFSGTVTLPPQASGHYQVLLLEGVRACPDTTVTAHMGRRNLEYDVLPECAVVPPLDSLVRSFVKLRVVPEHPCAGDTLTLQLVKNGCPPCVHLRSFGNGAAGNYGFEGVVDWVPVCNEFRCAPETLSASLGAHAQGAYVINSRIRVNVLFTPVPDSSITFTMRHEFTVGPRCDTTTTPCIVPFMTSATPPFDCAITVEPGGSGNVPLMYSSPVELGGLEGRLSVPAPFRVTNLGVAGHLSGVYLSWVAEAGGARWLVFTSPGVTLPQGLRQHLLNATLTADPAASPGSSADMFASLTLASDPVGKEVPMCAVRLWPGPTAILCVAGGTSSCDANGDGHLDVRDLVRMIRCMQTTRADTVGPSPVRCHDCDHDGVFGISDVFCCAREILRGPGIPHDSARVEPAVQVAIDAPVPEPGGVGLRLRVRVLGARTLDAALLRLRYPADRWRLQTPVLVDPAVPEGWLPLGDASEAGLMRVGALRLSEVAADELVYLLQAIPLAGAASSGTLTVEGADLTAPDGAVVVPLLALPSVVLGGDEPGDAIELSKPRPNPFTAGTTFSINLPREADVDLTVHDLAGRRVATLAQGRLGAGRRSYTWNGAGARDGVYFVRLSVNGRVLSSRVALLRDKH